MPHEVTPTEDWSKLSKDEVGGAVNALVNGFKTSQASRRENFVRNLQLYEKRSFSGYTAYDYDDYPADREFEADRLGLVRSAVESAVASVYAPQKPKPQFQTMGATWEVRRKAYKLDRICEGIINQRQGRFINVWAFMADAGVDAVLQGVAVIKIVANRAQKRIEHELVPAPDIFVDPAEGRDPQNFFQRAPITVAKALALYGTTPEIKAAISGAQEYEWLGMANSSPRALKCIEIQYAWRLPVSKDEPGRYVAAINGHVVEDTEWKAPAPPFCFLVWAFHRDGFWGCGVANEGSYMAEECSDLDKRLHLRELLASGQTIYYPRDQVKPDDLALNEARKAVAYDGPAPPTETTALPFHPMELEFLQFRVQTYWDALGLSQVSAAARREPNITSAVGQMTLNDTKAGRQLPKARRYEELFVDLAHQYVWRLRELADEDPEFYVQWPGKTMLRQYKFGDADVEDEAFTVTVAPSAALPHDPAGRQDQVQAMYNNKFIGKETARQLMGWPDLDNEMSLDSAETEYVDMLIERYLDASPEAEDGAEGWSALNYEAPEGFITNKLGALRRFAAAWFRAKTDTFSLPKEEQAKAGFNLNLLTRWIKEMSAIIEGEAAKAAALQNGQQVVNG